MRDNSQRAKIAMILIWIILLLDVAMTISGYFQLELLYRLADGTYVSDEEINSNDSREVLLGLLYTVVYIVSVVTFIRWFRRAYYNLHQKKANLLNTEGWAAGAWFVPILNLIKPYEITKELFKETHKILSENVDGYKGKVNYTLIGTWWFVWIITNFTANISTRLAIRAETVEELISCTQASLAASIIGIPLAFLVNKVISNYAEMETQLFALRDQDEGAITKSTELNFKIDDDILDDFE